MEMIHVTFSHDFAVSEELTPNFRMYEVWEKANPPKESFDYPACLVIAGQKLRDWSCKVFGCEVPWRNTSTYRDRPGQLAHGIPEAIDLQPVDLTTDLQKIDIYEVLRAVKHEIMEYWAGQPSELMDALREAGITGFGIEPGCLHMDCNGYGKDRRVNHTDKYGVWTVFEWAQRYNPDTKQWETYINKSF